MVRIVLYLLNVCLHQGALLCVFVLKVTSLVLRLHHCMSSATDHQLCLLDLAFGVCSFSLVLFIPFVVYHSFGSVNSVQSRYVAQVVRLFELTM